ncbi:hypothetical protein ScPMuIL_018031 [Solemya velum]
MPKTRNTEENRLPVDRGWAWMIMLALWIESFVVIGIIKSFGIFFVEFLDTYGASTSMTSMVSSVSHGAFSLSAFLCMSIGLKFFSVRRGVIAGALIMCVGFIITSFSTSIALIIFSYGIVFSLGTGLTHGPAMMMIGKYFKKKRGCANGIAMSGSSLGSLVFPIIIRYIIDEYGLQGSFILLAGVLLQVCIAGSFIRPTEFYTKSSKVCDTTFHQNETAIMQNGTTKPNEMLSNLAQMNKKEDTEGGISLTKKCQCVSHLPQALDNSVCIEHEQPTKICMCCFVTGRCSACQKDNNKLPKIIDCSILRNNMFIYFLTLVILMSIPASTASVFIAGHARDLGIGQHQISFLLSCIGIADFVGRITLGILSDIKFMRRSRLLAFNFFVFGIVFNIPQAFSSHESVFVIAAVHGLFSTSSMSMLAVLLMEMCGLEAISNGMGIMFLVHGFEVMALLPLFGAIRDITGSYMTVFHICGSFAFVCSVCLLFEPTFRARFEKTTAKVFVIEETTSFIDGDPRS